MAPSGRAGAPKTFTCDSCDKTFSRREYVVRHARQAHEGVRPFHCTACNSGFARSDILRRHQKTCTAINGPDDSNGNDEDGAGDASTSTTHHEPIVGDGGLSYPSMILPGNLATTSHSIMYPYSHPSNSSSATTLSPTDIPDLSPPGGAGGGSSASSAVDSPQTPYVNDFTLVPPPPPPLPPSSASSSSTTPATLGGFSGKDQTLAPEFTGTSLCPPDLGHSRFTQDEILASEVLEDLLRSPHPYDISRNAAISSAETSPFLQSAGDMATTLTPWHGAKFADVSTASNENSLIAGSWDAPFSAFEVDNKLENSPEAAALADYFNKGGVGGITALDLGFTTTPSIFKDNLWVPQPFPHTEMQKRFFLPKQKFCLGYLYPWHVPPVHKLSEFAESASNNLLATIPVLHRETISMADMPGSTAFALSVAGAAYDTEGENFSNEMLIEKRVFLVRGFNKEGTTEDEQFATLQSLLLYQLIGLFHKEQSQRYLAHTFHASLIMMLQQMQLPLKVRQSPVSPVDPTLVGAELEKAWKAWIALETRRRVCFIVFLTDLETASTFDSSPLLPFSDLTIDLPSSEALWNAPDAAAWLTLYTSPLNPTPVSFVEAIRCLLSPEEPAPFSDEGILLRELGALGSLPLMVLSRTLSFLAKKTEEALKQADPFRTMLNGFGILEDRERENRDVLRRIENGRAILRKLPGGVARGGGEGWFEAAMPKPKPTPPPPSSSFDLFSSIPTATDLDLDAMAEAKSTSPEEDTRKRAREEEKQREYSDWTMRHTKRRAQDLQTDWPEYMPQLF